MLFQKREDDSVSVGIHIKGVCGFEDTFCEECQKVNLDTRKCFHTCVEGFLKLAFPD